MLRGVSLIVQTTSRFDCYLASLEARHMQLVDEVDKVLTPDASHWSDMMNGCDELNDRLAIAKLAAKSRLTSARSGLG